MDAYTEVREKYVYCATPWCGATGRLEAHHIVFRSRGGKEENNLVLLCENCHRRLHDERMTITGKGEMLTFTDRETGEIAVKRLVPQVATGPSVAVDESRTVQAWLDSLIDGGRLSHESDEALKTLYQEVRQLKRRAWMAQAAIINEMQSRASYGDKYREAIAEAIGCHVRTVSSRGQIYRDIISNPECSQAIETLEEEAFYKEAVSSDAPAKWINYAAERKTENPRYSVAQFRAEMKTDGEESSLEGVMLFCRSQNSADTRLAESLERKLGVPVTIIETKGVAQIA